MEEKDQVEGAFISSLKRNNKQIKDDRAEAISEDTQIVFKREVEDLQTLIKKKKRDRENMLDMSPTNSMSLIVASDFDGKAFVEKDLALGLEIRNLEIKLGIAEERYNYLFNSKG